MINVIVYRLALEEDIPKINYLLHETFTLHEDVVTINNINQVYVASDSGMILAICVLRNPTESDFEDWEIAFVTTRKSCRNNGLATELMKHAISNISGRICASAWRTWDNPSKAHIHTALLANNFKLVEKGFIHWSARIFCKHTHCTYANDTKIPTCHCWEDIYIREEGL